MRSGERRTAVGFTPARAYAGARDVDDDVEDVDEAVRVPARVSEVQRAVIVVNELAPGATGGSWRDRIQPHLPGSELIETRVAGFGPVHDAVRQAVAFGAELVIVVGGDGTINAAANAVRSSATRLCVIPAGTANDLAGLLGQPRRPSRSIAALPAWEEREIDAISINGTWFSSVGGIGLFADVAARANRWRVGGPIRRWLWARVGSFIYTLALIVEMLRTWNSGGRFDLQFTDAADNRRKQLELDGFGVLVANARSVGRSFHLVPDSRLDDGVFELIVFPRTSKLRLLRALIACKRGRLLDLPEISWFRVTRAAVATDVELRFFGDGEVLDSGRWFDIGLAYEPVRLMAPPTGSTRVVRLEPAAPIDARTGETAVCWPTERRRHPRDTDRSAA